MSRIVLVQHCPVYADIAPYISIVTADARATVNSIYRGDSAATLLHKYGKHTQRELYDLGYPANPPGFSSHELKADGTIYGAPRGSDLAWWQQGFDVNDRDVPFVITQAAWHGWRLFQPYYSGNEYHHLNWRSRPRPTRHTLARIIRLRATLPRS